MMASSSIVVMTLACLILLSFAGCGSGLSGETLTESGHQWIGLDISQSMLSVYNRSFVDFCNILLEACVTFPEMKS